MLSFSPRFSAALPPLNQSAAPIDICFPTIPGTTWEYQEGPVHWTEVITDSRMTDRTAQVTISSKIAGEWHVVKPVAISKEMISYKCTLSYGEIYESLLFKRFSKKGDSWRSYLPGGTVQTCVNRGMEEINTPAGRYTAVRIDIHAYYIEKPHPDVSENDKTGMIWLVDGIGIVKQYTRAAESVLKEFKVGTQ